MCRCYVRSYYRKTRLEATQGVFVTDRELGEGVAPMPEHIAARSQQLVDFDVGQGGAAKPVMGRGDMGDFGGMVARHRGKKIGGLLEPTVKSHL